MVFSALICYLRGKLFSHEEEMNMSKQFQRFSSRAVALLCAFLLFSLVSCDLIDNFSGEESNTASKPLSSQGDLSSSSSFEMETPQMDSRVIAYVLGGNPEMGNRVISEMEELKKIFKTALNDENFDPDCNYFAALMVVGNGLTYPVVAKYQSEKLDQDEDFLAVYHIKPSLHQPTAACRYPQSMNGYAMLICDREGGLIGRLHYPPAIDYNDSSWDCSLEARREIPHFEFKE